MTGASHLTPASTVRPIVLCVEDRLTREYLLRVWQPDGALFNVQVVGGKATVCGMVREQRVNGAANVFGLVDRDFGVTNRPRWNNPDVAVFRFPKYEIENYLLSWPALAGCNLNRHFNRSAADLEARAIQRAQGMVWWMSCRSVLSLYEGMVGRFPGHPPMDSLQSQQDVETYVANSEWIRVLGPNTGLILDPMIRGAHIAAAGVWHQAQLRDDEWIREYSGKELFQHLRGYIVAPGSVPLGEADVDLAKSVAEWQVANGQVPAELLELKTILKTRVGL